MDWKQNAQQIREDFDRDGFVILRDYLSAEEVADLNNNIERYKTEVLPTLPKDQAFYEVRGDTETIMRLQRLQIHDAYFRDMYNSERFLGLAHHLMDGAREASLQWFNKPAEIGQLTPAHQDGYYFMLEPNEAVTIWVAIDKADEENGCVRYVSGSHLKGMRPHQPSDVIGFSQGITDFGEEDTANEVAAIVEPGDVILHHCMTIHRADANESDRSRSALGFVYDAERAVRDAARRDAYQKELKERWKEEGKI